MPVMIGVDPHKASHTAAALDEHGRLLDRQRFSATLDGSQALRQWAGRWDDRRWAVEGANGVGRARRVRMLSTGHGRKSDPDDAVSVAFAARSASQLRQVGVEDQAVVLHLLTNRREDLVRMRTQTVNRLHRLLVDLVPGGAGPNRRARRRRA
jgi:transposase